jgi:hypothetical protein
MTYHIASEEEFSVNEDERVYERSHPSAHADRKLMSLKIPISLFGKES